VVGDDERLGGPPAEIACRVFDQLVGVWHGILHQTGERPDGPLT
jgi:hypothetical protein